MKAAFALLALLGTLTWRQGSTYLTEETLWRTTIERNPASWLAENDLGLTLAKNGQTDEAITHCGHGSLIWPDFDANRHAFGGVLERRHEAFRIRAIVALVQRRRAPVLREGRRMPPRRR